jgi:hypothetical protein
MSYLQGRGIHVDVHLSNVAMKYRPTGFIADLVYPMVNVPKQSNMIKTYNQADLFRIENTIRAPGGEANLVSFQVGSDSYICDNYALKTNVTLEDRKNADPAFIRDLEGGRVEFISDQLKLDWDNRVAAQATTSTNVSTQTVVASAWTDYTNSRPLEDCWTVMDLVEDATGYRPNRVAFSGTSWRYFSRNAQVIDKIHQTGVSGGGKNASKIEAAGLLEVDQVAVGRAYKNTAEEAIANSLSRIWGDHVLLYYTPQRASIEFPSFAYTFRWKVAGLPNMTVERLPYNRTKKSDEIEIGYYQDEKILSTALGVLISWTGCSQ